MEWGPDVTFAVHELVQKKWVLDPFLEASLDDERYFVTVWNEPTFGS